VVPCQGTLSRLDTALPAVVTLGASGWRALEPRTAGTLVRLGCPIAKRPSVTSEQLTLVTSAVAAASSLIVIAISVRSTGKTELGRWRRQEERELIARIMTKAREVVALWDTVASQTETSRAARGEYQTDAKRQVEQARQELRTADRELVTAFAEVELVAGSRVVDCIRALEVSFENMRHVLRPASGADDQLAAYRQYASDFERLLKDLIDAVRKELRIERAPTLRRRIRGLRRAAWLRTIGWRSRWRASRRDRHRPRR